MKFLFTFLLAAVATVSYSQTEIKTAAELKDHLGDSVRYCGKVAGARMMDKMNNTPVFLNIDEAYPRQTLTVVIWGTDQKNFAQKAEEFYLNKNICISGKLEKFKEQLQVVVRSEAQLVVQQ